MSTARGARSVFKSIGRIRPRRNAFDLSYDKRFTCDMGQLIPIACDHVFPGDTFKIGCEIVARFQPLVAPIYHEVNIQTHWFFVPYRLLWSKWEEFITGGEMVQRNPDGSYIGDGLSTAVLPRWYPTSRVTIPGDPRAGLGDLDIGSLWDFLGFPIDIQQLSQGTFASVTPLTFPRNAYYFIYNEYYRDENLQNAIPLTDGDNHDWNSPILNRNWTKDYFTSSLPFQQKGVAPALPITGSGTVNFPLSNIVGLGSANSLITNPNASPGIGRFPLNITPGQAPSNGQVPATGTPLSSNINTGIDPSAWRNNNFSFNDAITFNVADLRLSFQIQKWLERNARGGTRYTEWLQAHYGVSPSDARLDRPEYIGGTSQPMVVSEVLQTSSSDATSPQGNFSGHGLSAGGNYVGSYRVPEFGLIMGIMSIMPKPGYQDRLDRQWTQTSRYDFFFPEFVHLSEQAILSHEIRYVASLPGGTSSIRDNVIFGYQGRYDEHRIKHDMVCSEFRVLRGDGTPQNPGTFQPNVPDFSHWHLIRHWDAAASLRPILNSDFITCRPSKRIFAVSNKPGVIVNVSNLIRAIRPMPSQSNPGLIDHM